jgi:hypothetical protein
VARIDSTSKEYVRVPVEATNNGLVVNPTADTVEMAFPAVTVDPAGGDWKAATWETDSTGTPVRYWARCLVGPGGTVTLAVGLYDVWVRITDAPEIPVKKSGQLEVF